MFSKFTTTAFVVIAPLFVAHAPAMAGTGMSSNARVQMTDLIQKHAVKNVSRRGVRPAPYAFKPTRRSHNSKVREVRRVINQRSADSGSLERQIIGASGCAWAKFQQCRNERALGKNVTCYFPGQ